MHSVFILQHSYDLDGYEETKFIGVYKTRETAQATVERLQSQPGFIDHPDDFTIEEYELDKDQNWVTGFSTVTTIMIKDCDGKWEAVTAACRPEGTYEIVDNLHDESLGEFKTGDTVRCELIDGELHAVEKIII